MRHAHNEQAGGIVLCKCAGDIGCRGKRHCVQAAYTHSRRAQTWLIDARLGHPKRQEVCLSVMAGKPDNYGVLLKCIDAKLKLRVVKSWNTEDRAGCIPETILEAGARRMFDRRLLLWLWQRRMAIM